MSVTWLASVRVLRPRLNRDCCFVPGTVTVFADVRQLGSVRTLADITALGLP